MFHVTHPLYGKKCHFDSWTELVDATLDIAIKAIQARMNDEVMDLADEMIETAEEYDA